MMVEPCTQADRIERIEHAIYGNGEPGIRTHLAVLNNNYETTSGRLSKIEGSLAKVTWLILIAILTAVIQGVIK